MERTILVIDDEERLAQSLGALLRAEGYSVDVAVGGQAGINHLMEKQPLVVITDLRMPETDGFAVMRHLAEHCPETRTIVITGHASTESAIEAIHQGVADFITKPFEYDFLRVSVEKVFAEIEAQQLRNDTIRMLTHDIKVPLTSVVGFAQLLMDRKNGTLHPKAAEFAETIMLNSQKTLGLLDNFLTRARAEGGSLDILAQPMKLHEMVQEAVRLMQPEFHRSGITLEQQIDPIPTPYEGDEPLLFRAVSNLLNNAAKYTPRGGTVVVVTQQEMKPTGEVAIIQVSNTGPGIQPAEIGRVFDKYRRSSSARGIQGSGLGLFVVRCVTEAHGGAVDCTSTPGELTTFRMSLPLPGSRRTTPRP